LSFALLLTPLVLFFATLIFLPVLARLFRQCHFRDVTPEFLENFSPVAYRPMEFLLAEEDFDFLNRQPGFETSLGRKLRRDRIRIFRQYLNRLIRDFNRLHVCARYLLARTEGDHSALLSQLIWLRLRFTVTVLRVEASLLFSYFGFRPRVVGEVIARLDEMNSYLRALSAA
jgi:hypothetical protein